MDGTDVTAHPATSGFLHRSYFVSLAAKGLLGAAQLTAGLALMLTPAGALTRLAHWLVVTELAEDPTDRLALLVQQALASTSLASGGFYSVYLIIHGLLNLGFVVALLARLHWAYPGSIMALFAFVGYQLYKFSFTADPMMLILSAIDVVVIALIWHEYRQIRPAPEL
jgi:uncharacterized membrane protein